MAAVRLYVDTKIFIYAFETMTHLQKNYFRSFHGTRAESNLSWRQARSCSQS
jgi:hypothetical protein